MKRKGIALSLLMAMTALYMGSCNVDTFTSEKDRQLTMVYTDWSEGVALTYLSQILLEEKMDYRVTLKLTDVKTAYRELAEGKADVFADAWLPETQKQYYDQYAQQLDKLGITYPEARTGLVVPDYSPLKTVSDLAAYDHPVIGIDIGAGVMLKTQKALEKYAPDKQLRSFSEDEMVMHLEDSIKRRKNIVVTGWEPHWIFARYDVRFLEDPDSVFGEKEKIYTISRKGLEEEHPHAVRFFERMQLSEKQLNSLVYHMRRNEDPMVGIRQWIEKNQYVVNIWVKDLKTQRKKIM